MKRKIRIAVEWAHIKYLDIIKKWNRTGDMQAEVQPKLKF